MTVPVGVHSKFFPNAWICAFAFYSSLSAGKAESLTSINGKQRTVLFLTMELPTLSGSEVVDLSWWSQCALGTL